MPTYTRQVDAVDTNSAADINELQVGIEGLSTGIKRVTADQTTTATAAADVTGMSFAIAASEVWSVEWNLQNGCSGTGGVKWTITVPASATFRGVALGMSTGVTALTSAVMTVSGTLTIAFNAVASTAGWMRITAVIVNSTTAGTVQLRFASTTSGQTSTVYTNSSQVARRIA